MVTIPSIPSQRNDSHDLRVLDRCTQEKKYIFIALKHTLFVYICGEPFSAVWLLKEAFRGTGMCPIRDSGG